MATYEVTTHTFEALSKKLTRIINKCKKQGVEYHYEVSEPYTKYITREKKHKKETVAVEVVSINIDLSFRFNGWHVLGSVSRKTGVELCFFSDDSLVSKFCHNDYHCDHCHHNRLRHTVVIVQNENGEIKQVGSTCLDEFTCGLSGDLVCSMNDVLHTLKDEDDCLSDDCSDLDHCFFDSVGGYNVFKTSDVVACAIHEIKEHGFASKSNSEGGCSTAFVLYQIDDFYAEANDSDREDAQKAIEWIKGMSEDDVIKSSYLYNLSQIVKEEFCSPRHFGFLASLYPSYQKAISERIEKEHKAVSNYIGNVGERISVKVTLSKVTAFDTMYGTCFCISMVDENSNRVIWMTSKAPKKNEGDIFTVVGTVKEHKEYKGCKQTSLSRCKFV